MTADRLWRKHILPLGTITYGNREVNFTPAYLADISDAFTAGALDLVPFGRDSDGRGFTLDPETMRGIVRMVFLADDGLEAVIDVDPETDTLLDEYPDTATGARLIECYRTTGREFPVVLAGVYTTRAPMLIGLRPWTREPAR